MRRATPLLGRLLQATREGAALEPVQSVFAPAASVESQRAYSTSYAFTSLQDAPPAASSSLISLQLKAGKGKKVDVTASAGKATVKASYDAAEIRKLQDQPTNLCEAARISVLHSSFMDYLLRLSNERYSILAQWPDFTAMYGKDVYFRSHPEDLRKFYALVDEYHRMYDVVTEFDSLSTLAVDMVPAYRKKRMNVLHPAITPTTANGAVTQFLLSLK